MGDVLLETAALAPTHDHRPCQGLPCVAEPVSSSAGSEAGSIGCLGGQGNWLQTGCL